MRKTVLKIKMIAKQRKKINIFVMSATALRCSEMHDELVRTSVSISCDSDFKGCSLSEDAFAHV